MGLLSLKDNCSICNKEVGLNRYKSKAGWLCPECYKVLSNEFGVKTLAMNKENLQEFMTTHNRLVNNTNSQTIDNNSSIVIEFEGTAKGNKCHVKLLNDELTIRISKLLNLKEETYNVKITDVIVFAESKSGKISKGVIGFRFINGKETKEIMVVYNKKHQWRADSIIAEVNKYIREIRSTCLQCNHVHYFDGLDVKEANSAALLNLSKGMMAIGGFLPLALLPDRKVTDFNKCQSCGSRNVKLEEVVHKKSNT